MDANFNRRILVIDDNRSIREDFRKILSPKTDGSDYQTKCDGLFVKKVEERSCKRGFGCYISPSICPDRAEGEI
jgi:hypothetical protein